MQNTVRATVERRCGFKNINLFHSHFVRSRAGSIYSMKFMASRKSHTELLLGDRVSVQCRHEVKVRNAYRLHVQFCLSTPSAILIDLHSTPQQSQELQQRQKETNIEGTAL